MSDTPKSIPSFSTAGRWRIGFDLLIRTVLVLAVVVMANYLAAKFSRRYFLSSQTQMALSPRTLAVLRTITNRVDITLYYDTRADDGTPNFYADVDALLKEYQAANRNIYLHTVDYVRDPGLAQITKDKYRQYFTSQSDKDLIIFDSGGRVKIFPGAQLIDYKSELKGAHQSATDPGKPELEFERRPIGFNGELAFTSRLLSLANPQPLKAYFMQGHGEVSLADTHDIGYQKFASVLNQNYITLTNLDWLGSDGVPMDCNLLIIANPNHLFKDLELQEIDQYLREGGRLLIMLGYGSYPGRTGLEPILQKWGVSVMDDTVQDFKHTTTSQGFDIIVSDFGKHPVVESISQAALQLYTPRPVLNTSRQIVNAPQVDELFGSSPSGTLLVNRSESPHQYPLACAVEQKPVAGVNNPRGNTRIIVVGDATFWGNLMIDSGGNRDFLNSTVNWLCDRPFLLEGIGPRPVTNFRLQVTAQQKRQLNWLLLGALPGGALLLGWIVWFVRRK